MKLYSDEESDYICRDSRAVPLALRDQGFKLIMDDDHVSLFNPLGYQKRTYHTRQMLTCIQKPSRCRWELNQQGS
jgi:hypothetical protein